MTGKEKIESALSPEGTPEVPAVICYEDIFIRDHWDQITGCPWWYRFDPCTDHQLSWQRDYLKKTRLDWFMPDFAVTERNEDRLFIDVRPDGVFLTDKATGLERMLSRPPVGGDCYIRENPADTVAEIDRRLPAVESTSKAGDDGLRGPVSPLLKAFKDVYPLSFVGTPLNEVFFLMGFEETMTKIMLNPGLVRYACGRCLDYGIRSVREAAAAGASGVFIQDCFSDMISPVDFKAFNLRYTIPLAEEIRSLGMKSIFYFCGNPAGKLGLLLDIGADALSLEESKKNFRTDIADVSEYVNGRCALLGNLDAIGVLQDGSDDRLRAEIKRQLAAGAKNKRRFIMSLGSPVTPSTRADRVGYYSDIVHESGVY